MKNFKDIVIILIVNNIKFNEFYQNSIKKPIK